jgi:hypothetical protein
MYQKSKKNQRVDVNCKLLKNPSVIFCMGLCLLSVTLSCKDFIKILWQRAAGCKQC